MHRILAPAAALVLAVAACGGSQGAATVDGEVITFDEAAALTTSEGDALDPALFANSLGLAITVRVLTNAMQQEFGLTITESEIEAEAEEMVEEVAGESGQTEEDLLAEVDWTPAFLRAVAAVRLMEEKVAAVLLEEAPAPTEEELARYEAEMPNMADVCSAHILLESREEAEDALARALGGEDFGALAVELSVGPSGPGGGDLGCAEPARYVPEFAAAVLEAEVGVPYGPVETQFGWHLILVTDRTIPSFEEVREEVRESLAFDSLRPEIDRLEQEAREDPSKASANATAIAQLVEEASRQDDGVRTFGEWALERLTSADVQVEPEYGAWTTDPVPSVVPPS